MSERIVYRLRDTVTGGWKAVSVPSKTPIDFDSPEEARTYARFLKRWRVVKVTIRTRPKAQAGETR